MAVGKVMPLASWLSDSESSSVPSKFRSWKRFIKGASFFFGEMFSLRVCRGLSRGAAHSSLSHSILDPL